MAFIDRVVEYPNRVRLTQVETDVYDMTREEGTVTEMGTPLNAYNLNQEIQAMIEDAISGITIDNNGNVNYRNLQSGRASAKYVGKAVTSTTINFPRAFTKVPRVVASLETAAPNVTAFGITGISTTGFTINIYRDTTASGNINFNWIAHV